MLNSNICKILHGVCERLREMGRGKCVLFNPAVFVIGSTHSLSPYSCFFCFSSKVFSYCQHITASVPIHKCWNCLYILLCADWLSLTSAARMNTCLVLTPLPSLTRHIPFSSSSSYFSVLAMTSYLSSLPFFTPQWCNLPAGPHPCSLTCFFFLYIISSF